MLKPLLFLAALALGLPALAANNAPWGSAPDLDIQYAKQKVVYDTTTGSVGGLTSVLDRVSYLSVLNDADPFDSKIVVVLHGEAIHFFAIKNYAKYKDLMDRAQSLTVGGNIEFRMCKLAAQSLGYKPKDIHGFVSMVPMGDAEIIRLQQEGYSYMR